MNVAEINPLTLPSIPLLERTQLPNCSAIYFVMQDECVLYIGRTINLAQRWEAHHKWDQLVARGTPVKIAWLECRDESLLTQIETALIRQFAPELNGYVTDKKKDPNYGLVRGLLPQELLKKFKIYCIENGVDYSQGLENLLREYFEWKDQQTKSFKEKEK
ncbi:MAG: GIY-YIG nuclease family protein [Cyanobacteria bacterium J06649_11]